MEGRARELDGEGRKELGMKWEELELHFRGETQQDAPPFGEAPTYGDTCPQTGHDFDACVVGSRLVELEVASDGTLGGERIESSMARTFGQRSPVKQARHMRPSSITGVTHSTR